VSASGRAQFGHWKMTTSDIQAGTDHLSPRLLAELLPWII